LARRASRSWTRRPISVGPLAPTRHTPYRSSPSAPTPNSSPAGTTTPTSFLS